MKNKHNTSIIQHRLQLFRSAMKTKGLQASIVKATDNYLNEYIPKTENDRIYLSAFTGSKGDMLITHEEAFLFVDGRYHTQADLEVPASLIQVVKVPLGLANEEYLLNKLKELTNQVESISHIGLDPRKISFYDYQTLKKRLADNNASIVLTNNNLIKGIEKKSAVRQDSIEKIPESITGKNTVAKLNEVNELLKKHQCDFFLVSQLAELAWLTNLRTYQLPFSSSFKGVGFIGLDSGHIFIDQVEIPQWIRDEFKGILNFYTEKEFLSVMPNILANYSGKDIKIGFDEKLTSQHRIRLLKKWLNGKSPLRTIISPIASLMKQKNDSEINHLSHAYNLADKVVKAAIDWTNNEVNNERAVSEKDVSDKVRDLFFSYKAKALSFEVISAFAENSAIIHYSNPDPDKILTKGNLMLLDTGGYFEGGYATDLTRTFLVGGDQANANPKQKEIYSVVLKASIRLMKSRFPKGTKGIHLDTITRSVLWDYGYTYDHGTGHGLGINVHETPPRISSISNDTMEENMILSVEPGIYIEGYGGVRIENLITIEKDSEIENWLRIKPLTFSPLDKNLIDENYLDESEKKWLYNYFQQSNEKMTP